MNAKITFDTEAVLRDLAGEYAEGKMGTDEYLDMMEMVCREHIAAING